MTNNRFKKSSSSSSHFPLFLFSFTIIFIFIIFSHQFLLSVGEAGKHNNDRINEEKPTFAKLMKDTISMLKKSHQSSWDKVKSIIREFQLQIFPPNLDFRGAEEEDARDGAGGKVIDAAEKSFATSKEAVEKSATTAAKAVGEAVHKTTEKAKVKVKDSRVSDHDQDPHHDEL